MLAGWLAGWLAGRLAGRLAGWPAGWLAGSAPGSLLSSAARTKASRIRSRARFHPHRRRESLVARALAGWLQRVHWAAQKDLAARHSRLLLQGRVLAGWLLRARYKAWRELQRRAAVRFRCVQPPAARKSSAPGSCAPLQPAPAFALPTTNAPTRANRLPGLRRYCRLLQAALSAWRGAAEARACKLLQQQLADRQRERALLRRAFACWLHGYCPDLASGQVRAPKPGLPAKLAAAALLLG